METTLQRVDVETAEREQLAAPQRGPQDDDRHPPHLFPKQRLDERPLVARKLAVGGEQRRDLVLGEDDRVRVELLRPVYMVDRVLTDPLPPARRLEDEVVGRGPRRRPRSLITAMNGARSACGRVGASRTRTSTTQYVVWFGPRIAASSTTTDYCA